ncbi:hypothetical protein DIPPA_27079 [Diplonema papillatum]|nr:hypothetical protein DIPPA_23823 [Diplonema papillatum]KAJ9441943.1 hypothetical protein DIPPA_25371 [Diplonema papillatum]KAJ9449347.1 hypothetical protein DIPPA_27079 [Diplonema papillatum]
MMRGMRSLGRFGLQRGSLGLASRRWRTAESGAPKIDPFEAFEGRVSPDSSDKEIKEAYRELIKVYHTDINPDADPEKMVNINEAYRMLIKMNIKGKIKNRWFKSDGDEPPVPRSDLQERVYRAEGTAWEESTQLKLFQIKRRFGTVAYWVANTMFVIISLLRMYKIMVYIMLLMMGVQVIRSMMQEKHQEKMRERRKAGQASTLMLTKEE